VIAISPTQKYGIEDRNEVAGSSASAQVPRRQPATMPSEVPRKNAMMVETPTRNSVHGRYGPITVETGVGKTVKEMPRLPWNSCDQ
jgi:hypothetical protein